ncbi:ChbG/HpnK family deacetylase [Enterococcus pallens]|uniref:ChbG/HpnK family deacetylase n=1 Tax=Enterococcus pallens ATCC BAA-351 TaxID=1158607 RepID=R2QF93_9ENTE|nr:ChbG/HpnK family deacetylase [Enterococcus pallens]EOH93893.1 hypothetical protein UAU_02589 [Enterococcus pallens ATCC BAA-351]EOU24733.1 hypothetical protein I588_00720 [Enterococcus pallens ATCC BAA-351]
MRIIVNADDFGLSHEANLGIRLAMEKGICTQTSVVTNSNYFDEAVAIAKEDGFMDKVGLHINLFEGTPLSAKIKKLKHYCYYDSFRYQPPLWTAWFRLFQEELTEELEAQIRKYRAAGFTLYNIDSHHCAFYDFSVLQALLPLLEKYGFKTMRGLGASFNTGNLLRNVYIRRWQHRFNQTQLQTVPYTSSIATYRKNADSLEEKTVAEIYCHPVLIGDYLIDNFTGGTHLEADLQGLLLEQQELITTKEIEMRR